MTVAASVIAPMKMSAHLSYRVCDASPVLKLGEQVLDRMTLSVEGLVAWMGVLAVFSRGDAGRDAEVFEGGAEAVAVVAAVGDQLTGRR